MKEDKRDPYYRPAEAAVLRASAHIVASDLPPWPRQGEDTDDAWRVGWLATVWAQRPVAEAIAIASPALAGQIDAVLAGRPTDASQLRRMTLSLARYMVRMRGRATPFGAFAGVSGAAFGPRLSAGRTSGHRLRTRADSRWLAEVIASLEASTALRRRLPVVMNNLATVRGGRLVVTWQPHGTAGDAPAEVSVRLIPVVHTVMSLTRSPVRVGELIDKLAANHPGARAHGLEAMVGELMARGVLISSLRAPATTTDALAHLLHQLHKMGTAELPETHPLVSELQAIHQQLRESDRVAAWPERLARQATAARMHELSAATDRPLVVDLRLGCTLGLPQAVADEAATAAQAMIRLSPAPTGNASWREFHGRFLSRYGIGTPVALDQLTDPITGLGFPRHFTPDHPGAREVTPRDEALLALAQQAALEGTDEVVLDEKRLDALTGGAGLRPVLPVDLWVEIRASASAALDAGDFTLAVSGFGRRAAHTGRFLDLLDDADHHPATAEGSEMPTGVHGALAAQLSFPPRHVHQENVQRVPLQLDHVISLAEHGETTDNRVPVHDLAVVADRRQLYVVSLSRRRVVEAMLLHSGARHTMPPLARLLLEIPRSVQPQVTSFDWGAASHLPFLPRVRYGRTLLAPARWSLDPADLPGPTASSREWSTALEAVRERRGLPANLAVGSGDRQLRLDLNAAMDTALLRTHLDTAEGPITVTEAPTAADLGWFDGRAHELVVPLTATAPPAPAPAFLNGQAARPLAVSEPRKDVVYAKLYGPAEIFDMLLTEQVPKLLACWDTPPTWWFVRYRHPAPHLRLRVHDTTDPGRAAGRVAAWAQGLRALSLLGENSFDIYRPETGRYGVGAAMTAAEELFAADSMAVLAQLAALSTAKDLHPQALTAASLIDLTVAMTGSTAAGMRWLTDHPDLATTAPMRDREIRQQTLRLTNRQALHRLPSGEEIVAAWATRAHAATRYAASLSAETTHLTPGSVLTSLLHMHHIRALGIDAQTEAMTHKLARSVALAQTARHRSGQEDAE